ncbi:MAG: molybdenum ABC transporter ATP-binding protein [Candidatus Latescibacteria bacterium]|nr:molybdenum ABC transporter ATP-binding protein [Candidatus Latescibacterota bacterium]
MLSLSLSCALPSFTLAVEAHCAYPVTAIFGPSGAGKTTLLNLVAGLRRPDWGEIRLGDELLFSSEKRVDLPPEKRRIGYVFQDDLLFPHLTAAGNLRYGHDLVPLAGRRFAFGQIVELLELGPLLERRPAQLSGGERQRVALGRALLASPRLLLMDEPLSSLDQGLKSRIIPYLRHIRSELGIPILYVSHSVAEILELTGQVIFLDQGEVVAQGDFFHLAHHPRVLPLVEEHGFENVLPVEVLGTEAERGFSLVRHGVHQIKIPLCDRPPGSRIFIGIRADDIILCRERPHGLSVRNFVEGQVVEISRVGGKGLVYVEMGKRLAVKVTAEAIDELGLEVGQRVTCLIKTHSIRIGPEVE